VAWTNKWVQNKEVKKTDLAWRKYGWGSDGRGKPRRKLSDLILIGRGGKKRGDLWAEKGVERGVCFWYRMDARKKSASG